MTDRERKDARQREPKPRSRPSLTAVRASGVVVQTRNSPRRPPPLGADGRTGSGAHLYNCVPAGGT